MKKFPLVIFHFSFSIGIKERGQAESQIVGEADGMSGVTID
jgi:hypothetical protein